MELIIVSIGALSKNALWNERAPVRSSHATTSLVRTTAGNDDPAPRIILIDPSLPAQMLLPRIEERSGILAAGSPANERGTITHVFLTNWRPVHRRALQAFANATWWMHEAEIEAANDALDRAQETAERQSPDTVAVIEQERSLLAKIQPAPDNLAEGVDLFPLPGYSPGQCGLLISEATRTTVIAGDAVPTAAHFLAGQVFGDSYDLEKAKESLAELYEIADVIVPGHDNLFLAPRTQGM